MQSLSLAVETRGHMASRHLRILVAVVLKKVMPPPAIILRMLICPSPPPLWKEPLDGRASLVSVDVSRWRCCAL